MKPTGIAQPTLGWPEWVLIGSAVGIAGSISAILSPAFRSFVTSDATIGWVQAAGVLLAIIMSLQGQRASEQRRQLERIETIRIVVEDCQRSARLLRLSCDKGEHMALYFSEWRHGEFDVSAEMLKRLDIYDLPNSLAMRMFVHLQHHMGQLTARLKNAPGTQWHTDVGDIVRRRIAKEAKDVEDFASMVSLNLTFRGKPARDVMSRADV